MFSSNGSQVSSDANYIEDVFSTYLYTGNGATNQTITNNIDLSTKGGLCWVKNRSFASGHFLSDSGSSFASYMSSNATTANTSCSTFFGATTSGFTLTGAGGGFTNNTGDTYVSWTFRKQPKFFDIVTYTGNGAAQTLSHNLGSVPGCMIVKKTSAVDDWYVYHRSTGNTKAGLLNSTGTFDPFSTYWNNTSPTSTQFTIGSNESTSGATYVVYLFAHDAGGFGLTGTDNVISCGTFTTSGTGDPNATVNLGYEPQWLMFKKTNSTSRWAILDNMRSWPSGQNNGSGTSQTIEANTSAAEFPFVVAHPTATGFTMDTGNTGDTYIYIAIRRGPMKVPTDGTKVFSLNLSAATQGTAITTSFPVDFQLSAILKYIPYVWDRLRGVDTYGTATYNTPTLRTSTTNIEATNNYSLSWNNTGFQIPNGLSGTNTLYYSFRRAPSFFDEVCYMGTGSNMTVSHNLGVAPELMIVKVRSSAGWNWAVYAASQGATKRAYLNDTSAFATEAPMWNSTAPTASVFSVGSGSDSNPASGATMVAYLFATCAGVSKVGSYTGNGSTQTIACGFAAGARFVLIKRTDSTGDWYVWDTVRGIVSGNDPYFLLNSSTSETTTTDYIDPYSAGFELSSTAPAALNASGGTYIFLAIA